MTSNTNPHRAASTGGTFTTSSRLQRAITVLKALGFGSTRNANKGKAKREWRDRLKRWEVTKAARVHKRDRPTCGAKCRDGHACKARAVWDDVLHKPVNGRCRMHGGLSTGARTPEGLERIRSAQLERWRRWREAKGRI